MALKLIIAGAPGAGKGTQCEQILERYGVVHISTGDILRAEIKNGTELGLKAKACVEGGKLVSDDIIIDIVLKRLSQPDCQKNGWMLDGVPRTAVQAEQLTKAGAVPGAFILLQVPDDILVDRITGRRVDPKDGKIYHVKKLPTDPAVVARLVQRPDDTEEKLRSRLADFHTNINAVRGAYASVLTTLDGTRPPKAVTEEVFALLDKIPGAVQQAAAHAASKGGDAAAAAAAPAAPKPAAAAPAKAVGGLANLQPQQLFAVAVFVLHPVIISLLGRSAGKA